MEIIWTKQAEFSYNSNIEYLENFWTEKEIVNFELEVFRTLEIIENNINIGKEEKELNCKSIIILKQITLFYDIIENYIVLLNFWNNKQDTKKRGF
jgi:hypothetical protein